MGPGAPPAKLIVKSCVKSTDGFVETPFAILALTVTVPGDVACSEFPVKVAVPATIDHVMGERTPAFAGIAVPDRVIGVQTWPLVGTPSM